MQIHKNLFFPVCIILFSQFASHCYSQSGGASVSETCNSDYTYFCSDSNECQSKSRACNGECPSGRRYCPRFGVSMGTMIYIFVLFENISITSLLTHTVALSTRPFLRFKSKNQPIKKFLSLEVS